MKKLQIALTFACLVLIAVGSVHAQKCGDPETLTTKAAFRSLAPVKKAAVWKGHLQRSVETEKLSREQRAVVYEALNILQPDTYENGSAKPDVTELVKRISTLFTKEQAARIFYDLEPIEAKGFTIVPVALKNPMLLPDCSCNFGSHPMCNRCDSGWNRCDYSEWGCGPLWVLQCEGICKTNDESDRSQIET